MGVLSVRGLLSECDPCKIAEAVRGVTGEVRVVVLPAVAEPQPMLRPAGLNVALGGGGLCCARAKAAESTEFDGGGVLLGHASVAFTSCL